MHSKPFAIAIAGGSGSGKTSLTRALVSALSQPDALPTANRTSGRATGATAGCSVLDHDSYYRDLSHQPVKARAATNFDHPSSLDNALLASHVQQLLQGRSIERPRYDFASHTRLPETDRVESRPVIICEGILLLAVPELRRSFDLRLYVDTPADVRALRRVQRDIAERGRTVDSVISQYLRTVRPMHEQFVEPARKTADVIVDWRMSSTEQARSILQILRERQDERPLTVGS